MIVLERRKMKMKIKKGLLETFVGTLLVVYPEPATTKAGLPLIIDGVKKIAKN